MTTYSIIFGRRQLFASLASNAAASTRTGVMSADSGSLYRTLIKGIRVAALIASARGYEMRGSSRALRIVSETISFSRSSTNKSGSSIPCTDNGRGVFRRDGKIEHEERK